MQDFILKDLGKVSEKVRKRNVIQTSVQDIAVTYAVVLELCSASESSGVLTKSTVG